MASRVVASGGEGGGGSAETCLSPPTNRGEVAGQVSRGKGRERTRFARIFASVPDGDRKICEKVDQEKSAGILAKRHKKGQIYWVHSNACSQFLKTMKQLQLDSTYRHNKIRESTTNKKSQKLN